MGKPEEALERDRQVHVAAGPEPAGAEGVEAGELALAQLQPCLRVGADDDVGVLAVPGNHHATVRPQLDAPAHAQVLELDAVAGAEALVGPAVTLGEGRECVLHLLEPPFLCLPAVHGDGSV